jgi:transposase
MTKGRFADEFKAEAVKQVIERGYAVGDVAKRLGISVQSLYKWGKVYSPNATDRYEAELKEVRRENLTLKAELRRAQDERDILKKQPRTSRKIRGEVRVHLRASGPVCGAAAVPPGGRCTQWVLCLGEALPFPEG